MNWCAPFLDNSIEYVFWHSFAYGETLGGASFFIKPSSASSGGFPRLGNFCKKDHAGHFIIASAGPVNSSCPLKSMTMTFVAMGFLMHSQNRLWSIVGFENTTENTTILWCINLGSMPWHCLYHLTQSWWVQGSMSATSSNHPLSRNQTMANMFHLYPFIVMRFPW